VRQLAAAFDQASLLAARICAISAGGKLARETVAASRRNPKRVRA